MVFSFNVPMVIFELDGHEKHNYVVFEIDNPTNIAADIRKRLREQDSE